MIIRRSIRYGISLIAVQSTLVFWGITEIYNDHDIAFGMLLILMGSIFIVATYFGGLRNRNPAVTIDNEGISATGLGVDKIYWQDVKSAKMKTLPRAGQIIAFELYDESKYSGSSSESSVNRLFGLTTFYILVDGLDISPRKIYDEINSHIAAQPSETSNN